MLRLTFVFFLIFSILIGLSASEPLTFRQKMVLERETIVDAMIRAKNWQESAHGDHVPTNWLTGTFYSGVFACFDATGDRMFLDAARDWCEAVDWKCGEDRPLHADDICSAQTFLDVYSVDKKPHQIEHIRNLLDEYYFDRDIIEKELMGWALWPEDSRPYNGRNLWWWCDALYMAPPVMARVAEHTGDQKYTDLMHELYWDAVDFLYDEEENLFYRDSTAFPKRTPNGKKFFWGRGNGWVTGGLVRTMDYLDDSDPYKKKYMGLYQDMIRTLVSLQGEDGLWGSSVNDRKWLPEPESSASSFYTFAIAAGINRGWLDKRTYLPYLVKAWEGLLSCLRNDGRLEWAQLVDGQPRKVRHEDQKNYAQGAFLLAASEMYKLNMTPEQYSRITGNRRIVKVSEDAKWKENETQSSVFWNNHLLTGKLNRKGNTSVSLYLLPGQNHQIRLGEIELFKNSPEGGGNLPSLLTFGKDSVLTVYPDNDKREGFKSRFIKRNLQLMPEKYVDQGRKVFNAKLIRLDPEGGKILNFYQDANRELLMAESEDNGKTWSDPLMILSAGEGSVLSLIVSSHKDGRVDFFYSSGLEEKMQDNMIYHVYFEDDNFYKSDGKKLRSLKAINKKAIHPSEGSLITSYGTYEGISGVRDIEKNGNGEIAGVYSGITESDDDNVIHYGYARFDPKEDSWIKSEISYAGYNSGDLKSTAGGICIDPEDLNIVYFSSKLDPSTGKPNGTEKYQIYKAVTMDRGNTWEFEQLTFDLKKDNLMPYVPQNKPENIKECILWMRSDYGESKENPTEIVGFVSPKNLISKPTEN